ncbi:double-strand break repair protein AddB [Brevundimonas lenta]|uniref:ATP-dependent helicase/nuclease subunit B n=1 Tax=Brevundimonas lenta TaxID=424796 RepID=A0A7W6JAM9_9CAUL|nr:double-strand break repair protein AddB [Brevundimonas lenta]MBB4081621.1 ATP-dependent helicase/nuclease subunit B [Brevundimonas lenta]
MAGSFDPFAVPGPRWYAIEAHRPFLEDLAVGVLDWLGDNPPEALSDAVILLPNRRAARAFTDALSKQAGGRSLLLPQVRPLGDLEEDEPPFSPGDIGLDLLPAISPMARRFEMARMIAVHDAVAANAPLHALEMADALGAFLDSCQIEEVTDPGQVASLVHADMAGHWQQSADFLAIAVEAWPARLAELGLMDPAARRTALLRRLAESWDENPPHQPLIVAGSTGTVPAAAAVMGAAARAPNGCVVLPGLDIAPESRAWDEIDEQHPQGALKRLLDRHGIAREAVRAWRPVGTPRDAARRRLIGEALTPPKATADWRRIIDGMEEEPGDPVAEGLDGLTLVTARAEEEAAAIAAVLMREALETPDKTTALVTPDPLFARRVQARLSRWGLEADSSAGAPLAETPVGTLIALLLSLASEPFSAATVLAVLKHPLVHLGLDARELSDRARELERYGLRGPRPGGWAAVEAHLAKERLPRFERPVADFVLGRIDRGETLLAPLQAALDPWLTLFDDGPVAIDAAARALTATLERLARDEAGATDGVWRGAEGEAASRLLSGLITDGAAFQPLSGHDFARMTSGLLTAEVVRTGGATHPRLRILGAIEARLARADRMILAGIEEGVWPRGAPVDPFLSRPMRKAMGLPPPERRIGLSAHDFAQSACAPEVILLHTERRGGQPSVKSRWLWRLETLVGGAGLSLPGRPEVLAMARALDAADATPPESLQPAQRPAPTPPVHLRPRRLSVTRVEEWVRDPYATYARFILRLDAQARPDEQVDARLRGTAIHAALEAFAKQWPELNPTTASTVFAELYLKELRDGGMPETALAREAVLARNAGDWVVGFEAAHRAGGTRVLIEQRGVMEIDAPREPFRLSARADRLEARDGRLSVIDFKTGGAPTWRQVRTGFSPQLSLTAAIAQAGGFPGLDAPEPERLLYVTVTGRRPPAKEVDLSGDKQQTVAMTVEEALDGLKRLIGDYERPTQAYLSRAAPQFAQRAFSDYDHLARVREWSVVDDDAGGEE